MRSRIETKVVVRDIEEVIVDETVDAVAIGYVVNGRYLAGAAGSEDDITAAVAATIHAIRIKGMLPQLIRQLKQLKLDKVLDDRTYLSPPGSLN